MFLMLDFYSQNTMCYFPLETNSSFVLGQQIFLLDFEIFGGYGVREKEVRQLLKDYDAKILLHRSYYPKSLEFAYEDELLRWKKIVGADIFIESPLAFNGSIVRDIFTRIFSHTAHVLGRDLPLALNNYLKEIEVTSLNFQDLFRYFPFFLKKTWRDGNSKAWQIARWEWLRSELSYIETPEVGDDAGGAQWELNPTLFVVNQELDLLEMNIKKGIYALFVNIQKNQVMEIKILPSHALIIQTLENELCLDPRQIKRAVQEQSSANLDWDSSMQELKDLGIILC